MTSPTFRDFEGELTVDRGDAKVDKVEIQDEERLQAITMLVADTLELLQRDVADWLSPHLVQQDTDEVGVYIRWKFGQVDSKVVALRTRNAEEEQERIADLQRLAQGGGVHGSGS